MKIPEFICTKCPEQCKLITKTDHTHMPNKCVMPGLVIPEWKEIEEESGG